MRTAQEFMTATDMTTCGSVDEKLRWAFKMYDGDGSGKAGVRLGRDSTILKEKPTVIKIKES